MDSQRQLLAGVSEVLAKIDNAIIEPLIALLFGLALVYFLWGVFVFIRSTDDEKGREEGRNHMIWGIIGMVIMVSVRGIIAILLNTFGINLP